jgi:uncharacterized phage protein (TIGR02218 family)
MSLIELFSISAVGMSSFRYTDSNEPIGYAGLTYYPYPIKRNKISFSSDLKVDETNLTFANNWGVENAIAKDMLAGADVRIIRVDRDIPDDSNVILFDGEIGDTKIDGLNVFARCQTLDFLNIELPAREYQVACNWRIYDTYCGLTVADYTVDTTVTSTTRNVLTGTYVAGTSVTGALADDYWTLGWAKSNSGMNDEVIRQITSHIGMTITVVPPFPFDFISGTDTLELVTGCDHSVTDCGDVFNNLINYGGFPFIPNQDTML